MISIPVYHYIRPEIREGYRQVNCDSRLGGESDHIDLDPGEIAEQSCLFKASG